MIEKLKWNSNVVSWEWNKKNIEISLDNIIIASSNDEGINIKCGKNYIESRNYLYDESGKLVFGYDINAKTINWIFERKEWQISNINFIQALHLNRDNIIVVLENEFSLSGFDGKGNKIFNTAPNQGYKFAYISTDGDKLIAVCDGDKKHSDQFGRNRMNFNVNKITGEIALLGLGY